MRYHPDEFFRLIDSVEEQGGTHLDEVHEHVYHEHFTGDHPLPEDKHLIEYCEASALILLPYDATTAQGDEIGVQPVKVCAVDDMVGRWPRFAEADARGMP
jgi:predicted translin family RNA/ssDNA-binding protein